MSEPRYKAGDRITVDGQPHCVLAGPDGRAACVPLAIDENGDEVVAIADLMSPKPLPEQGVTALPDPAVRQVTAVMRAAFARCAREGIGLEDFYVAMMVEQQLNPADSLPELVADTFARLKEKP